MVHTRKGCVNHNEEATLITLIQHDKNIDETNNKKNYIKNNMKVRLSQATSIPNI